MPLSPEDQAKHDLWKRVLEHNAIQPTFDQENLMIEFRHEGLHFVVPLEGSDPMFFVLLLPNIWPLHNDIDRSVAGWMSNRLTVEMKVAKVFVNPDGGNVSVSCEIFYPGLEAAEASLRDVLPRLLEACIFTRQRFGQAMQQPRASRIVPMSEGGASAATGPTGPMGQVDIPMPSIGPLAPTKKGPEKPN